MKTYIALLRGVMPSGKNRVPMADLRAALAEAGFPDVKTYIQTGNVILRSDLSREEIQGLIHEIILDKINADITVIARTRAELQSIFESNPFPPEANKRTYFTILESEPEAEKIDTFLALDFTPDEIVFQDDSIVILFATKYSDSKFNNNFIERKLKVATTTRNFNTMSRLLELSA
jgi:uncharacterized protein (DUF1697 family)